MSVSDGYGRRNAFAARLNESASARHCAGVPFFTGMVVAGKWLYFGMVIPLSALAEPTAHASTTAPRSEAATTRYTALKTTPLPYGRALSARWRAARTRRRCPGRA